MVVFVCAEDTVGCESLRGMAGTTIPPAGLAETWTGLDDGLKGLKTK